MGQQPGAQQQPASPAGSRRTSVTGAPLPPAGPASSRQLKVDEQQVRSHDAGLALHLENPGPEAWMWAGFSLAAQLLSPVPVSQLA